MASSLRYLTVQDVLWINLQVTKKVNHFNYARLEEATFYQYAYGESKSLLPQAARFVSGFLRLRPLDIGNEATIFVALIAFLRINGQAVELSDEDGAGWFEQVLRQSKEAEKEIARISRPDENDHHDDGDAMPNVPAIMREVLADYPNTIQAIESAPSERAA